MNAIELLTSQHRVLEKLFSKLEKMKNTPAKQSVFVVMADTLAAHVLIEEQIFYPAIKVKKTEDILLESLEEHLAIKRVLSDLLKTAFEDETFDAKLKVLTEQATHHHEEEEEELFPKVKKLLDKDELEALGEKMNAAFEQLVAKHVSEDVPSETAHAASL